VAWLVHDDVVLASLEIPATRRDRARGLIGRDDFDEAMLIRPCRSVHTFGMRFPIDVAFVDDDLVIRRVVTMKPNRVSRPSLRGHAAVEVPAGTFGHWGLGPGDQLEVRE
jgi:hypothetical protein